MSVLVGSLCHIYHCADRGKLCLAFSPTAGFTHTVAQLVPFHDVVAISYSGSTVVVCESPRIITRSQFHPRFPGVTGVDWRVAYPDGDIGMPDQNPLSRMRPTRVVLHRSDGSTFECIPASRQEIDEFIGWRKIA